MLKILVASHDAGGANILSSLIKKYRDDFSWMTSTSGPASDMFLKNGINLYAKPIYLRDKDIKDLVESLHPDFILTGTGWSSDFERNFLRAAKAQNIKSASFLDHWCNYRERFGYPGNWKENLPNFVFVVDRWAHKIALENGFPRDILRKVENPYFEEIAEEAELLKGSRKKRKYSAIKMLYLSQPIRSHALRYYNDAYHWGYTEYEVMKDLLKVMDLCSNLSMELKVRLHPAERINKYSVFIKDKAVSVTKTEGNSLVDDCVASDVVIGSGSMALVAALIIGKKAISYIPAKEKNFFLPQKEIYKVTSFNRLMQVLKSVKINSRTRSQVDNLAFNNRSFLNFFNGESRYV